MHNSLAKYFREKADIKHLRIVLKKFILATPSRERISLDCFRAYCALEKYSDAFKVGEGLFSVKKIDGGLSVVCNPWLDDRVAPKSFWKKQFSVVSNTCVENKYKVWKVFYLTLIEKKLDYDKSLIEIKKICRQFKGRYRWMRFSLIPYFFRYDLRYMLKELSGIVDCIPHDYLVRCRNGEALLSAGRTVEGFKQFETAIAMNDSARGDIEAWKGEMLLMTGEYKKAFESLEIAVRLKAACALCWRSVAYFKMGHIQESLNDFGQVVEKFPEDIEARVWKAEILRTLGRFNESLEDLNFIIKNRSDYNFALFNRALVYYELGDYRNMRKDFVKIDSKLIGIISIRLRIKKTKKINSSQIYKILRMGLKMAKGNRRAEKYLLQIQFPEYKSESTGEVLIGL